MSSVHVGDTVVVLNANSLTEEQTHVIVGAKYKVVCVNPNNKGDIYLFFKRDSGVSTAAKLGTPCVCSGDQHAWILSPKHYKVVWCPHEEKSDKFDAMYSISDELMFKATDLFKEVTKYKKSKTTMQKLSSMMKKLLDADTQALVKAEYLDTELDLTDCGRSALWGIIFDANKPALVAAANAKIAEAEAKKA